MAANETEIFIQAIALIENENKDEKFVVGMKVDVKPGSGWEANAVFNDVHEIGRLVKKEIREVRAVRVTGGEL